MRQLVLILLALLISPFALAQHQHATTNTIDGSVHPELVSESTAYRLFFLSVAEPLDATAQQRELQKAQLAPIMMSDAELLLVMDILARFKTEYSERVDQYNSSISTAIDAGLAAPDFTPFLRDRDLLVGRTVESLRSALSQATMERFEAHVQSEKRNMIVDEEVQ